MTVKDTKLLSHHERIYRDLKQRLNQNDFNDDEKLPSLRDLSKTYGASIGSVRQALVMLEYESLIMSQHGKGYFVKPNQKSKRILLLESGIHDHLFSLFVQKFQEIIGEQESYLLQIESAETCFHPETAQPQELLRKIKRHLDSGIDAIFFDGEKVWGITPQEFEGLKAQVPIFYYNNAYPPFLEAGIPGVSTDWFVGGYKATRHLIDIGCRHIMVAVTEDPKTRDGCRDAVADATEDVNIYFFDPRENLGDSEYFPLFKDKVIDGFFGGNDSALLQQMPLLQHCGYRIPEDIALLGIYDTPWAQMLNLKLSSLNVSPEKMIQRTWDMYIGQAPQVQEKMQPILMARESTLNFKPRC